MKLLSGAAHRRRRRARSPLASTSEHKKSSGQSIVELVIILPVLLLLVMAALDLGRVFYGWVVLNNAARVGANYAALHADAWGIPADAADQTTYTNLVTGARNDAAVSLASCDVAPVPAPAFPTGTDLGDYAEVVLTCPFNPITPIIGDIFASGGNSFNVTARSVFPIRSGAIAGSAVTPPPSCLTDFTWVVDANDSLTVNFTDTTPPTASGWIWDFGDVAGSAVENPSHQYANGGTYTVELQSNSNGTPCTPDQDTVTVVEPPPSPDPSSSPGPSPSILPSTPPGCIVTGFTGVRKNGAQALWDADGFTTTVQLDPNANQNQNWVIESQSLVGGQAAPCNVTITISPDAAAYP